jgi:hypothetical protein
MFLVNKPRDSPVPFPGPYAGPQERCLSCKTEDPARASATEYASLSGCFTNMSIMAYVTTSRSRSPWPSSYSSRSFLLTVIAAFLSAHMTDRLRRI